jgi:outer membrane protein TolC
MGKTAMMIHLNMCNLRWLALLRLTVVWGLLTISCVNFTGCSRTNFKNEADAAVYEIINKKWDDDFGQKANYLISDVEPDVNEIQVLIPTSGMLSLARAAAIATAQNRDYQRQRELLYLKALDLTGKHHKYARQWFASLGLMYQGDDDDESVHTDNTLGFDNDFLFENGMTVGVGVAVDWIRFLSQDPRTTLGSILSADIAIPILGRGAGKVAWEELTQAEHDVVYQIRSFCRFRKSFIVSIVSDYYRLLQLDDSMTNTRNSWESKMQLTQRLRMEAAEGRVARFQVDQAEQSELAAKERYLRRIRTFDRSLDAFKDRLALPPDSNIILDQNELTVLMACNMEMSEHALEEAIEVALEHRLDLTNIADQVADAARKVELAADGLGVQLELVGSARVESRPDRDFTSIQFHKGSYNLGLTDALPLDRLFERNAYREATIALLKVQRDHEQKVAQITLEVRESHRRLEEEAESHQTALKSLDLARMRVKVSPLLWAAQRMNTRDLLEAQDALLTAKNAVTHSRINYATAKLEFFRDIGLLNVRPDGMWEQQMIASENVGHRHKERGP